MGIDLRAANNFDPVHESGTRVGAGSVRKFASGKTFQLVYAIEHVLRYSMTNSE